MLQQLKTYLGLKAKEPLDVLREAAASRVQGYQNTPQMYEDFRGVFLTTEQGRRVLDMIMVWGKQFNTPVVPNDPYGTHTNAGQQSLAQRILGATLVEPKQLPTQQNTRRP